MEQNKEKFFNFFNVRDLPDRVFSGLWDEIVIDERLKKESLNYATAFALKLDRKEMIITKPYGIMLVEGETGNGKSTFLKGLASRVAVEVHKQLAIKTKCFELNTGRIFDHRLGESVKNIEKAFDALRMSARHNFTILLLDEIESIGTERTLLGMGDPSDVGRVVDSLLVEIDHLREGNFKTLILGSSNLKNKIDIALRDRADIVERIPPPDRKAALKILEKSNRELEKSMDMKVSEDFLQRVVDELYKKKKKSLLSGRDLTRLLLLSAMRKNNCRIYVRDVFRVARKLKEKK